MIFYFSGTGNTRFVAKEIAAGIGEELLFIPDLIRENRYEFTIQPEETVGFCFPTHGWQPPRIVREFIKQLSITRHPSPYNLYCWALTTCGDDMGEAMTILNKDLKAIGLKASTMFSVIMPESYVCLPFMYTDTEDKEQQKIAAAEERLPHIIACLRDRKEGIEELEKGSTPRL